MVDIVSLVLSNPKDALVAGYQALELIKKLAEKKDDPSIQSMIDEIRKGCRETALALRKDVDDLRKYCDNNQLDTSLSLKDINKQLAWYSPVAKITLNYQRRKINNTIHHFAAFAEDASAILDCRGRLEDKAVAASRGIAKRRDLEDKLNIDMPIKHLTEVLSTEIDILRTLLENS